MKTGRKGCNNCEHYEPTKSNMYEPDTPRYCRSGRNEAFDKWWNENGHKKDPETLSDMSCFEESKVGQMMDEMIFLTEKINELLKNKQDEN